VAGQPTILGGLRRRLRVSNGRQSLSIRTREKGGGFAGAWWGWCPQRRVPATSQVLRRHGHGRDSGDRKPITPIGDGFRLAVTDSRCPDCCRQSTDNSATRHSGTCGLRMEPMLRSGRQRLSQRGKGGARSDHFKDRLFRFYNCETPVLIAERKRLADGKERRYR